MERRADDRREALLHRALRAAVVGAAQRRRRVREGDLALLALAGRTLCSVSCAAVLRGLAPVGRRRRVHALANLGAALAAARRLDVARRNAGELAHVLLERLDHRLEVAAHERRQVGERVAVVVTPEPRVERVRVAARRVRVLQAGEEDGVGQHEVLAIRRVDVAPRVRAPLRRRAARAHRAVRRERLVVRRALVQAVGRRVIVRLAGEQDRAAVGERLLRRGEAGAGRESGHRRRCEA